MKKEIPIPLVVAVVVGLVAFAGFFIWRGTERPPIPPGQKTPDYTDEMPQYIKDAQAGKAVDPSQIPGTPEYEAKNNPSGQ